MSYYYVEGGCYEIYRFKDVFTRSLFIRENRRMGFNAIPQKRLSIIKVTLGNKRLKWDHVSPDFDKLILPR